MIMAWAKACGKERQTGNEITGLRAEFKAQPLILCVLGKEGE